MRLVVFIFLFFAVVSASAQKRSAFLSGKIIDENEEPVPGVSIIIPGYQSSQLSSDSGTFQLKVPADKAFQVLFSHAGFNELQKQFYLLPEEKEFVTVMLTRNSKVLETVTVRDEKERREVGIIRIDPKSVASSPGVTGGVEGVIKVLVGSNSELTSQYSVRGGNYDENLIYVNDFEIYRPYLVRNGQQEGLSFINPEMVKNISFYNGGFQAKYGDKISSVLDIQYKKPVSFAGSAYVSLIEQGLHLEGASRNNKFSWLFGMRSKTNRNILSRQETQGSYVPSAADMQANVIYQFSPKLQLELLGIVSRSRFSLIPESAQKSTAVFSPLFTANIGLDIFFDGREKDSYSSNLVGVSLFQNLSKRVNLKWMVSRYGDNENENFDITGAYLFGERSFDKSRPDFGKIVNPLGAGEFQNFARNELSVRVYNFSLKGSFNSGKNSLLWGLGVDQTSIKDKLNEWERKDSAGYSSPFDPSRLSLSSSLKSSADLSIDKYTGYVQDNFRVRMHGSEIAFLGGVRANYNSLNGEFIISPRGQVSFKPAWKHDFIFKASAGIYDQPPFYREMRRYDGTVNTSLKSQKSVQYVLGFDYNISDGKLPLRITTEAYYKSLTDVVPYDIDNVRIRYYGENMAKAYAKGIETRVFTELVKDAESWFSVSISGTKEDLKNDFYYDYTNVSGEIITSKTPDQKITDSVRREVGYVRRPTDRLITMGFFLQDYLSTNKNFKVHLNMIYGSNMSYNLPDNLKYRNALIIEPYIRVDIGFSALLLNEKSLRRSHSPFKAFDNIWASLEVFNLIDRANVISYQLIKDFANNTFSIPNRLTPRLINFKLLCRF